MIRPQRSRVVVDEEARTVTTTFPDGRELVAAPVHDAESIARARALGFGDGEDAVWAMTRTHDLLHTLIAEAQGHPHSFVLYAAATGQAIVSSRAADREERLVMLMQRALNEGVGP